MNFSVNQNFLSVFIKQALDFYIKKGYYTSLFLMKKDKVIIKLQNILSSAFLTFSEIKTHEK